MISQELFTKVATHLLTQNARAMDNLTRCRYRGDGGLRCAVGCLINDTEYTYKLEGNTVQTIKVQTALRNSGVPSEAFADLGVLQGIHDFFYPEKWRDELSRFAEARNLTMPEVSHA